jgi:hypothetical protein
MAELTSRMKVDKALDVLFSEVTQGLLYFYCAKSLHEAFQQSTLMQRSYFFYTVSEAVAREAILSLSKLTKEQKGSVTVHYVLNLVEKNPSQFSSDRPDGARESVADHRARLDDYKAFLENVWEHRDRVVAHLDRRRVTRPSDLFTRPDGVNLTKLGDCLRDLLGILNTYAGYYGREFKVNHLERLVAGDVDILVKWMCEHAKPEEWVRPPDFGDAAD